ncbi:MAG: BrnT family toxin [Spirochaetes bacterium]|nr:BrnT family toxin [Spirochaetota bacterium]
MKSIEFIWDNNKYQTNLKKHKISFDEAKTVFFDENASLYFDEDHSEDEERYLLLGMSTNLRILIVCHCIIENKNIIRIISARKATKNEIKFYRGVNI